MIGSTLIVLPAVASLALLAGRPRRGGGTVLVGTALVAAIVSVAGLVGRAQPPTPGHGLDATSALFLALVNVTFLGIAAFARSAPSPREHTHRFEVLSLAFLSAVNAVLVADHLLVQWVALEASALAVAPLIVRPGHAASRRASWHYVLFSSVALSLVLLGLFSIAAAPTHGGAPSPAHSSGPWAELGVCLLILGLGTKLGLAPMFFWLPEAYDEAPPAVSALLGAVQFNASLVMLLRVVQIFGPSHPRLVGGGLIAMGLSSMVASTANIIATRNIKRLLAYASINHAGVLAIALGLGRSASYGLLLYALSNAFIKAILFLTAGRIQACYRTKDTRQISGLIEDRPYSGVFLMCGTFALLGFPPFGSFAGELLIVSALLKSGHTLVFFVFGTLMTMTFVATGRTIFPMIWGPPRVPRDWPRQSRTSAIVKVLQLIALILLGTWVPGDVESAIHEVATSLERP